MANCLICEQQLQEVTISDNPDIFFRICHPCHVTHQKVAVKDIKEQFADPTLNRTLRIIVLDWVDKFPDSWLFEFYIANQKPFTPSEFEQKVKSFHQRRKHDNKIIL